MDNSKKFSNVKAFGSALLEARDLDPIYDMLYAADLAREQLYRWLLAYWWFYHAGVAANIASAPDFYRQALRAFDEKWPRGTERRHFRSAPARASIIWFQERFADPTQAIESLEAPTFQGVKTKVLEWPLFGDWIAFKVADMLERVGGFRISFADCELDFYDSPAKAALIVAEQAGRPDWQVAEVVFYLTEIFRDFQAPPDYARPLGVQEIETILCKYKSHLSGHYPVGKDRHEIFEGLGGWGVLASRLRESLKASHP